MGSSVDAGLRQGLPVFDPERFDAQMVGDRRAQHTMASLFLRQADAMAAEFAADFTAGGPAFGDALHRLKNTAHFVAGGRLLAAVKRAEAGGQVAAPARREAAVAEIGREFASLREAIARWLRAQGEAAAAAASTRP